MSLKNSENMNLFLAIFFLLVLFLVFTPIAFSHGGKHAPEEFTHLQALKKATKLYDKLIDPRLTYSNEEQTISMKSWCPLSGQKEIQKSSMSSLTPVVSMLDLILPENKSIRKYGFEKNFSEHDWSVKFFLLDLRALN